MKQEFDCTNYCGPQNDGKFCPGCKLPTIWQRKRPGELEELRMQTESWTGDFKAGGTPCLSIKHR